MRQNPLAYFIISLAALAWFRAGASQAASSSGLLTAREQGRRMDFENIGSLSRNRGLEYEQLVHSHREAAGYRVLQTKSPNNMGVDRIATRDGKVHFIQAKAFKSARTGAVSGMLDALEFYGGQPNVRIPYLRDNARRFVVSVPKDKFARMVSDGLIGRSGNPSQDLVNLSKSAGTAQAGARGFKAVRYRAVTGYEQRILTKVRFEPGPVAYNEIPASGMNRELQIKGSAFAGKAAPTGPQNVGKWLGRAGVVGLVASEGYIVQGFATGRFSEREFVTAQSAIVGGGIGWWGGAVGGAAFGALFGPAAPFTVPFFAVVGGIGGGFGGAKLAEMAASGFYGRLDEEQKQQVKASIYQHYGVDL